MPRSFAAVEGMQDLTTNLIAIETFNVQENDLGAEFNRSLVRMFHDENVDPNVFDAAVKIIERDGWCQGSLEMPSGEHCLMGAMIAAAQELNTQLHSDYYREVAITLGIVRANEKHVSGVDEWLANWNDEEADDTADVVSVLKTTGERIRYA